MVRNTITPVRNNKALDKLRADGTLKQISEKYFQADVTQ